jgi:hypothetical protein
VKNFRSLDQDLSVEEGELTPGLKIKRKVMETKYESLLDSMYSGQPQGVPPRGTSRHCCSALNRARSYP